MYSSKRSICWRIEAGLNYSVDGFSGKNVAVNSVAIMPAGAIDTKIKVNFPTLPCKLTRRKNPQKKSNNPAQPEKHKISCQQHNPSSTDL